MATTLKKGGKPVPFELPEVINESSGDQSSGSQAKFDVDISRGDLNGAHEEFVKAANDKKVDYQMVENLFALMSKQQDFSQFQEVLKHISEFPAGHTNQCMIKGLAKLSVDEIRSNAPQDAEIRRKVNWATRECMAIFAAYPEMKQALNKIGDSKLQFVRALDLGRKIIDSRDPENQVQCLKDKVIESKNGHFAINSIAALLFSHNEELAQDVYNQVSDHIQQEHADKILKSLSRHKRKRTLVEEFLQKNVILP